LKPGDRIDFDDARTSQDARKPAKKSGSVRSTEPLSERPVMDAPALEIIDETPDWIVINKPSGLLVHPDSETSEEVTLVDALVTFDPAIAKIGEDPVRPGIMHRLDKEASGIMVIARTQEAFENLKQQFAEHKIEKRYLALVYGEVAEDEGDLKFRIARSKTKQRMAARPEHESAGKAAWTHYKTLKRFTNASLLELDIFSGRTHQIRAHLLAFNHPIMGDPLYNRKSEDRNVKTSRLMLQSVHLSFKDPRTGETKSYDLPPAPEFKELMSQF
jgi:23S rRNA pseudouridine1911/1915/1917 synthase